MPAYCLDKPITLGTRPPPSAPTSPIIDPATAVVTGQRKVYTAFSRKAQFAAVRPHKNGGAILGLAVEPDVAPMLSPAGNEAWSERLKSRIALTAPGDVDAQVSALLHQAWERS